MARPPRGVGEDRARIRRNDIERRKTHCRIEVALDATIADPRPCLGEADPPVNAHDLARRVREKRKELGISGRERDPWNAAHLREHASRVRQHRAGVIVGGQRTRPRIEQLDHIDAGIDLRAQVTAENVREDRHEPIPQQRIAEEESLRAREVTRGPALDEVRGERERRTREADQRDLHRQRASQLADRGEEVGRRIFSGNHAKGGDVVR